LRLRPVTVCIWLGVAALLALRVLTAVHRGAALSEGDVVRFHHLGVAHGRPYVDYLVEYPILTLAVVKVFGLFAPGATAFGHFVVWSQFVLDLGVAALLWREWGRRAAIFYLVAAAPLVHLLYARLDLFATLAAVAAVALWRRGRPAAAGVGLALGWAFKLWPAVLAVMLLAQGRGRQRRALALGFAALSGTIAIGWLVLGSLTAPYEVLTYRGARGWEIESLVGAALLAVHAGPVVLSRGALRIGAVSGLVRGLLSIAGAALAGWTAWRGGRSGRIGLGWIVSIGALLVTSTLLSPQFMVWLLPGAAIAWTEGERAVPILVAVCAALTGREMHDFGRVVTGHTLEVGVLLARNALLATTVVVALARLIRAGQPQEQARAPGPSASASTVTTRSGRA
jgi:glycosyl transferase family 87